jgi:hypothetical protein
MRQSRSVPQSGQLLRHLRVELGTSADIGRRYRCLACEWMASSLPRRCEFDERALGSGASLFVSVDNLARPRDRCSDIECQVGVHLGGHKAWHESHELDADGDCEPVGGRGSDACSVAAPFSSPCNASSTTSLYSGLSTAFRTIVGFVVQSIGLRRATAPRSPVSATTVFIARS